MRLYLRGRIYYTWYYDEHGARVWVTTKCHDKKAAQIFVRDLERRTADPDHAAKSATTIVTATNMLLADMAGQVKAGKRSVHTLKSYASKAGHLRRLFGDEFKLAALRSTHVDSYIAKRREEGAVENTISKELSVFRSALKHVRRARLWAGDPAEVLPINFAPEYKPRQRWLTPDEVTKLLAELSDDRAARVAFIVATSARLSEAIRARREDVDTDKWIVSLRGSKTRLATRQVPIVLAEHRELIEYALEHAEGEDRLFRHWGNMRKGVLAACRRAGIPAATANDLRRTTSHWLRGAGAPLEFVWPVLGHVDGRMVERVYGKLSVGELAAALARSTATHLPQTHAASADKTDPAGRHGVKESPMNEAYRAPLEGTAVAAPAGCPSAGKRWPRPKKLPRFYPSCHDSATRARSRGAKRRAS